MNVVNAHRESSPYYPPRARWYSPLLGLTDRLGHALALERLRISLSPEINLNLPELVAGFCIPGLAIYIRGPRFWGKVALGAAALLSLMFLLFFGYPVDNLVFGLLLSLHVSGFVYYVSSLLGGELMARVLLTLATYGAVLLLVYLPIQTLMERFVATPLQLEGRVVVVGPIYSVKTIHQGDWIAYTVTGSSMYEEGEVYAHGGVDFAPVLALPGDQVRFSEEAFAVNGVPYPRLPYMPKSGSIVLSGKEWFIWPHLAIEERRKDVEARVTQTLLHMSVVTQEQFVGRPWHWWFWRRQDSL